MRLFAMMVSLFAGIVAGASPLHAGELIMLEQKGCVYCKLWDAEIGPAYPLTEEGRRAPLRKVDINQPIPDDLKAVRIERFTPTFILLENGQEVGRIRGYPGDEFFWFLLSELLEKAREISG